MGTEAMLAAVLDGLPDCLGFLELSPDDVVDLKPVSDQLSAT